VLSWIPTINAWPSTATSLSPPPASLRLLCSVPIATQRLKSFRDLTEPPGRAADILNPNRAEFGWSPGDGGQEGIGTRSYFGAFSHLLRQTSMRMPGRNRRPPRDPVNALLSFVYALLLNDCISALTAVGLDPAVGYLHSDRPGRPGLALDLMEEFRPLLADRTVLAVINRKQVTVEDFVWAEGGSVMLTPDGRRAVIAAYHDRCGQEVKHPLLGQSALLSQFPFIQARLLSRHIRGDLAAYPPCVLR